MKKKTKTIILSILGGILALILTVAIALYFAIPYIFKAAFSGDPTVGLSMRNELPLAATDVKEWAWADGFLPDYCYILKAKTTQIDFNDFISKLVLPGIAWDFSLNNRRV